MKIGIVSTSRVIDLFWAGYPQMQDIQVSAICCRPQSVEKARQWAKKYNIPAVYTDYEAFLQEGDFDFAYIGTVNSQHYPQARQALLAGRNVILEKPFTATAAETRDLAALATAKRLWLFEAITSMYTPGFAFLRQQLPAIGKVRGAMLNFSLHSPRYDQYLLGEMTTTFAHEHAGGALYDMNAYCLHLTTALLGLPQKAFYLPNRGWNSIDTSGMAILQYDGFTAACMAGKDSTAPNGMTLQGEKGCLVINGDPTSCNFPYALIGGKRIDGPALPKNRFAIEFEAFARIWSGNDRKAHDDALHHTVHVMHLLELLKQSAE